VAKARHSVQNCAVLIDNFSEEKLLAMRYGIEMMVMLVMLVMLTSKIRREMRLK